MSKKIIVSGVGCALVDRLFNHVSFYSPEFEKFLSMKSGDGGLIPGQLVFVEEFEKFTNKGIHSLIGELTDNRPHDKINIGGPSIVSLIHASQLSFDTGCDFRFYGGRGNDAEGEFIVDLLSGTPVNFEKYRVVKGDTPSTFVLSDPGYNNHGGERIFINSIGAAWNYLPEYLDEDFFASDIVVFGGTALVPQIHDNLAMLLGKARERGCITIVNTVYDFRNEKASSEKRWPMGESDQSYGLIDLLITDMEEACRLSGREDVEEAMEFFRMKGTGAVIVTSGTDQVRFYSRGSLFDKLDYARMPVSAAVIEELKSGKRIGGDTTGCGDNFAGGVVASVISQLQESTLPLDISEAVAWGVVSGGITTFYMGGMLRENARGEKRGIFDKYYELYRKQVGLDS